MPDPDPEVAAVRARLDHLEPKVDELTGAVKGNWVNPGMVNRLSELEKHYSEIRTLLGEVKTQHELTARDQADRDARRDKELARRDKRMNIYLGAGLTLIVTVLATLIISFIGVGGAAVIH